MNEKACARESQDAFDLSSVAPAAREELDPSGDEVEVIRKVESFHPYNAIKNTIPFERRVMVFIWAALIVGVGGVVVAFACTFALWIADSSPLGWPRAGDVLVNTSMLFAGLCMGAYPVLYFARYRKRHDDRTRHVGGEYRHRDKQIRLLLKHPLSALQSVDRFYESRPAGLPGFLGSLFGTGVVTMTTLGAVAGVAKILMDAKPGHSSNSEAVEILFAFAVFIVVAAAMSRHAVSRASYRRAVLSDAIKSVVAEEKEEKGAV
ncbi:MULTISPECIES: hypothetical protein [Luteibacter]|uniref:hypothetical protein n=1 Tax=Luteibacter TaxID=242605 RepID=UPI00055D40B6|nr:MULTISPECIES: hypothetical protein [unclassified Luteibacter]